MLRHVVFGAVSAIALTASANAADIFVPQGPVSYKDGPYVPATNWAGFYLGANVGAAWSDLTSTDVNGYFTAPGSKWSNATTGVAGGGQAGYNFQYGNIVFGPEIDFGGLGLSHTQDQRPGIISNTSHLGDGGYVDATGRLGYAVDRALFYVKGGYAYYDGKISYTNTGVPVTVSKAGVDGYTLGGGIEYKINPKWSVKGEYQYFDFGTTDLNPNATHTIKNDLAVNEVKVGVNYFVANVYEPLK